MSRPGSPSDRGPAPAGSRILNDRYRLLYKLGVGGMGSVWLAEDTLLKRSVALKELIQHAGVTDLAQRRQRAVQEARAMARVRNPAIVPIHDVFFIDDDPWIVMEYISGRSLQDIIKDHTLDDLSVARIGLHVLRGLIAVHRAGVVHRDVKPTNILVADGGSIFLVDFGIARIAGDPSLTSQAIIGTPEYLAPERFKPGYQVGPPADIWALGVTFYYAIEGYSPFRRDSERGWEATMMAILNETPRPSSHSGRLSDITRRMLRKDPARRADAHQVLAVLEHIVGGEPAGPHPQQRLQVPIGSPADPPAGPDRDARTERMLPQPEPERRVRSGRRDRDRSVPPSRQPVGPPAHQDRDAGHRGPRFDDARELIRNVGTDTGVAMLLAMSEDDAARILAECPPRLCGELLQGMAAARPAAVAAILRLLRSTAAGSAFAYLRAETAASLVALMTPAEAQWVLDSTDERTVAGVIMELGAPISTTLLRSTYSRQRAAQILAHVRPVTAAELLRSDAEFAAAVLRYLSPPVRKQVSRFLIPGREGQD